MSDEKSYQQSAVSFQLKPLALFATTLRTSRLSMEGLTAKERKVSAKAAKVLS
jgi:hypothetical protein